MVVIIGRTPISSSSEADRIDFRACINRGVVSRRSSAKYKAEGMRAGGRINNHQVTHAAVPCLAHRQNSEQREIQWHQRRRQDRQKAPRSVYQSGAHVLQDSNGIAEEESQACRRSSQRNRRTGIQRSAYIQTPHFRQRRQGQRR